MRELQLSKLVRLALAPAIAIGVSVSSLAQPSTAPAKQAPGGNTATKPDNTQYRGMRASQIIGKEVRNPEGKNIGQIRDLVVNMNTGQVRYTMLEFDPGIFQGERVFAVPTSQLRLGPDDQLVYNMTRDKLEQVAVPRADWNTAWRDPAYLPRLDKVWGVTQPSENARAYRATDLIGKDVKSRSGEDIGDLKELVVNMSTQKVHYAVLNFDPSWTAPDKTYLFPLKAFNLTAHKSDLVLDVDKAKVQAMKSFPANFYSNLNDRVWVADIDRYFVTVLPTTTRQAATGNSATALGDLFTRLDDDKSGWLDKAEVKDSADIDRNWTRLDTNKDGRISKQEFTSSYTIDANR